MNCRRPEVLVTRCALLFLSFCLFGNSASAASLSGRVSRITDGDSLVLMDDQSREHKINLAGIDSPEKGQDFGDKARNNLAALAMGKSATADCRKRDKYLREICVVTVEGKNLGLEQVRAGMAWWYREYISEQSASERAEYEQAELNAKLHRLGLWKGRNPTPPWVWRQEMRLVE